MLTRPLYLQMVKTQVAPALRAHGFKRSHNTFRRFNEDGDCTVIELQGSRGSWAEESLFFVNLATATSCYLEFRNSPSNPHATSGQWWTRLDPEAPQGDNGYRWRIVDEAQAQGCGAALCEKLETAALPALDAWLGFFKNVDTALLTGEATSSLFDNPPNPGLHGIQHFRDPSDPYGSWLRTHAR